VEILGLAAWETDPPHTYPVIDQDRLRAYLQLRVETQSLLPGLFIAIRDKVESQLADFNVKGVVGELDRENVMAMFPDLGYRVPLDWVAFGFRGRPFYDAHVGVVLETAEWPVRCHVGLHVVESVWEKLSRQLSAIDWQLRIGGVPEHTIAPAVLEHRLVDPPRTFDFAAVDRHIDELSARAGAYYLAAADTVVA
jgi:hypothetical protein